MNSICQYYNSINYNAQLHQLVNQEAALEPQALLERLSKEKLLEFEGKTDIRQFPLKIQKTLEKIINLRIGQDLFIFLCDYHKKPLTLQFSEEKSLFLWEKNIIQLNPRSFSLWKNECDGQCAHMPFKVTFVHELLHWKHSLEDTCKYKKMAFPLEPQALLDPELDDAEEQLAICGIDPDNKGKIVLCENHFRYAWKLPLRFTHRGVASPKSAIQKDMPIQPEQFAALFACYHNKLPPASYSKQALIVEIANPSPHQQQLMDIIKPFVQVHNLAFIPDPKTVKTLKANELWDIDISPLGDADVIDDLLQLEDGLGDADVIDGLLQLEDGYSLLH